VVDVCVLSASNVAVDLCMCTAGELPFVPALPLHGGGGFAWVAGIGIASDAALLVGAAGDLAVGRWVL